MIEQAIEIRTPDGVSEGFLFRPDRGRAGRAVLHYTDIGGIRDAHRQLAKQQAELGYAVLMPNIFYRTGKPPLFTFVPNFAEPRTQQRFAELAQPLTPEAVERDATAYVDFLANEPSVKAERLAVIGYCFSGAMALRTAAACPDRVALAASFHGGRLYTDAEASPHQVLSRVRARLYFAHADEDRSMPQPAIEALERALAAWGGKFESEVYRGARHGWTVPGSQVYDADQAKRAFDKLSRLLADTLQG